MLKGRANTAAAARRRLLPEGRRAGPMPWVIAIMMFLTVLAAAIGIGLVSAQQTLSDTLAGRATVQIVEADADKRLAAVSRLLPTLRAQPGVASVRAVPQAELVRQLKPWLGEELDQGELPIPALIDLELKPGEGEARLATLAAEAKRIAPTARVEPHAVYLQPLSTLMRSLGLLALGVVLLVGTATAAVVVLAARAAHGSHGPTIETLHMMGATDIQVARLFQRRIALDALLGSFTGFFLAAAVLLLLGLQVRETGSELLGALALPAWAWPLLALLPLLGVGLATFAARLTVLGALRRSL